MALFISLWQRNKNIRHFLGPQMSLPQKATYKKNLEQRIIARGFYKFVMAFLF